MKPDLTGHDRTKQQWITSSSEIWFELTFGSRREDPPSSRPTTASGCRAHLWDWSTRHFRFFLPKPCPTFQSAQKSKMRQSRTKSFDFIWFDLWIYIGSQSFMTGKNVSDQLVVRMLYPSSWIILTCSEALVWRVKESRACCRGTPVYPPPHLVHGQVHQNRGRETQALAKTCSSVTSLSH